MAHRATGTDAVGLLHGQAHLALRPGIASSEIVRAAALAPSGDNMQPWRFQVDEHANTFHVCVDSSRDCSPMNAGQRMARIAVGAAVENMMLTARHNRWEADVDTSRCALAVQVQCGKISGQSAELPSALIQRVTNRRLYDGRIFALADTNDLDRSLGPPRGVRAIWVVDRGQLNALASVIGRSDALMFGASALRKAFLNNIRFDRPVTEAVDEGLSLASLELQRGERLGLMMLAKMPDRLFQLLGLTRSFQSKAKNLVSSASGLCILVAHNDELTTDFQVGRIMQRSWLELTSRGCAVQPMMSFPVLDNLRRQRHNGCSEMSPETTSLADAMCSLIGTQAHERIAAILRFGYAQRPSGRTGRLPAERVTRFVVAA
jgi:nitroreductase